MNATTTPTAVVTGGSAGLGLELVRALSVDGWTVITDGRDRGRLTRAVEAHSSLLRTAGLGGRVLPVPGDVTEAGHRAALAAAVRVSGRLDLLVHNASALGPTPLPPLSATDANDLGSVWATNVAAPLSLTTLLLPGLVRTGGILLSISSDAAVEHYAGWGLYGATKAALDHLTLTFGAENPQLATYAVDPGDMRTQMHQDAFPGEDISDRPLPSTVVPALLGLIADRPPNGRYRAADLTAPSTAPSAATPSPASESATL
ncbi:SDR family NAD(P)-dependent oxidoreductase [Microlunatus elymi]|uniref:SDR family NAD(P)-dependent oxidoreductase n=1 Tax=Microlunatus elymi TaxID=2596828 RepID=A0A516Q074_9ACTN|nr:SDR family NAD(P)-dependent oxidoreductase [Microlunatus elymi]QDP96824.1 SDR family NAD(P)-dependent oxidoreductase [Microlunatus elymi]